MSNFSDFSSHGYQIIRELARNREAGRITYLATNLSLNQKVTIKEFRFASEGSNWSGFKAYEREIEVLQQLDHPRIPRYFDSFETPLGFCLVQEYKNAPSLAEKYSFTPEEIIQITVSVLELLVYLQKRIPPVIHRDIKPENILVDEDLNAYLVDFGLARIGGEQMALSSVAAGTPGFMPPEEQFGRPLSEASDLYSLGATLICLVTGTRSVHIGRLINEEYRFSFKPLVPQLSPWFVDWLIKMVEPNVRKRFANAEVALSALKTSINLEFSPKQNSGDINVLLLYLMMILSAFAANQLYGGLESPMNQSKSNQINHIGRTNHQSYNPPKLSYPNREVKLDAASWFNKGDRLFLNRRYHQALSAYNQALAIKPNHYSALIGRCATFNELFRYQQAFVNCNKAIEIAPNNSNARVWLLRGHALAGMKRYEESITSYDRAIQIDPKYSNAWSGRCHTFNFLKQYQQALPNCQKALKFNPNLSLAWHNQGVALEGLGSNEQALSSYEKALQFQPNYFTSIRNRQRLLKKLATETNNQSSVLNKDNFGQAKTPANSEMPSDKSSKENPSRPKPFCSLNPIFSYQYSTNSILNWQSVPDAKTYTVELDYSIPGLGWCSEKDNCKYTTVSNISTNWYNRSSVINTSTHQYGYNHRVPPLGRWRVWAVDAKGKESPKSAWCELRYTE